MTRILIGLIGVYRVVLSPLKPPCCRFRPSCSEYAADAIRLLGPWRGTWRALRRIARCHPWAVGGHDPVVPPGDASPRYSSFDERSDGSASRR